MAPSMQHRFWESSAARISFNSSESNGARLPLGGAAIKRRHMASRTVRLSSDFAEDNVVLIMIICAAYADYLLRLCMETPLLSQKWTEGVTAPDVRGAGQQGSSESPGSFGVALRAH